MSHRSLVVVALLLVACQSSDRYLRVTVSGIPASAATLKVTTIVAGRTDEKTFALDGKTGSQTFAIDLEHVPGIWGSIGIAAIDASACILAWQTSASDIRVYPAGQTTDAALALEAIPTDSCTIARTPGMSLIPAGTYLVGCAASDSACAADQSPTQQIVLPAFEIDRTEVTAGDYHDCVTDSRPDHRCTDVLSAQIPDVATAAPNLASNSARNWVTWDMAAEFCMLRDKALPSEAEWEAAARGLATQPRTYPWGEAPPSCALANYAGGTNGASCVAVDVETVPISSWVVSAFPSTDPELSDMAGNLAEWVDDFYGARSGGAVSTTNHVVKGGHYASTAGDLRGAARLSVPNGGDLTAENSGYTPEYITAHIGFRCARPVSATGR